MALFQWTEELSVGVREFDAQHQRMIQMMRELNEAMLQGKGKETLSGILAGLHQYTKIHFSAEERLFAEHGYADAEKHRMQHDYFIGKIDEFKRDHEEGKLGTPVKVSHFLNDWFQNHIKATDKQYTEFFHERGVR